MITSMDTTPDRLFDALDVQSNARLARGNIRCQLGLMLSEREQKALRDDHQKRLTAVSKAFYSEKYAP